jgi:Leucine-rich repeat (LRR) protein
VLDVYNAICANRFLRFVTPKVSSFFTLTNTHRTESAVWIELARAAHVSVHKTLNSAYLFMTTGRMQYFFQNSHQKPSYQSLNSYKVSTIIESCKSRQTFTLSLSGLELDYLPYSLFECSQIVVLDLSFNRLSSIPSEMGDLKNLFTLNLSNNNLTEVPSCLGSLTMLRHFHLQNNSLTILPLEFIRLDGDCALILDKSLAEFYSLDGEARNLIQGSQLECQLMRQHLLSKYLLMFYFSPLYNGSSLCLDVLNLLFLTVISFSRGLSRKWLVLSYSR